MSGLEQHDTRLGNVTLVTALHRDLNTRCVKSRGVLERHVLHLAVRANHGRMDDDGDTGCLDPIGQHVTLRRPVENQSQAELLREAKCAGDVLSAVGGDQDGKLTVEDAHERLER